MTKKKKSFDQDGNQVWDQVRNQVERKVWNQVVDEIHMLLFQNAISEEVEDWLHEH